jgi:hypothetical protein
MGMNNPRSHHLLSIVGAISLISFASGCGVPTPQPKGQIVVQAVSWPLVKKWAEPDASLTGHNVTVQSVEYPSVVVEKTTDATGILVFDVPAGTYVVLGFGDQPETITVVSGHAVNLKLVQH